MLNHGLLIASFISVSAHVTALFALFISGSSGIGTTAVKLSEVSRQSSNLMRLSVSTASPVVAAQPLLTQKISKNQSSPDRQSSVSFSKSIDLEMVDKQAIFSGPLKYFESTDVDSKVEPKNEWILNVSAVPTMQTLTFIVKVFVNPEGKLDEYELTYSSIGEAETKLILANFLETVFTPAKKGGEPVASTREIEINIEKIVDPYQQKTPIN